MTHFIRGTTVGLALLFAFIAIDLPFGPELSVGERVAIPLLILVTSMGFGAVGAARQVTRALSDLRASGQAPAADGYHAFYYSNRSDARLWSAEAERHGMDRELRPPPGRGPSWGSSSPSWCSRSRRPRAADGSFGSFCRVCCAKSQGELLGAALLTSSNPIQPSVPERVPPVESTPFATLGLAPTLLRAVADEGYTQPSPVQVEVIPLALAGRDVLACAQTGTGKTAAFVLPMLQQLSAARAPYVRGLILTPTRELAAQIAERIAAYGRHLSLRHAVIYGGVSQQRQEVALRGYFRPHRRDAGTAARSVMQRSSVHLDRVTHLRPRRGGPHARHGVRARRAPGRGRASS